MDKVLMAAEADHRAAGDLLLERRNRESNESVINGAASRPSTTKEKQQ
jgi:hypothetical protein